MPKVPHPRACNISGPISLDVRLTRLPGLGMAKVIWSKLADMNCYLFLTRILVVVIVVSGSIVKSLAQSSSSANPPQDVVVLTKLTQPVYPPLARQVRITGNVELTVDVRKDGTIQSAVVVSGHPLLQQAALNSAQRSQFECRNCNDVAVSVQLVYSFQLAGPESCCKAAEIAVKNDQPDQVFPRVIQLQNHITLLDRPACICDPPGKIGRTKVRSWKCLYLWRCGFPRLIGIE
jgi:TonB family protein